MLFVWIAFRLARAFRSTFSLLTNVKLMRALPWSYIQRLPRKNKWIGILFLTLCISSALSLVALAVPESAGSALSTTAFTVALLGITSSWMHGGVRRWQRWLRREPFQRTRRQLRRLRRS